MGEALKGHGKAVISKHKVTIAFNAQRCTWIAKSKSQRTLNSLYAWGNALIGIILVGGKSEC